MRTSLNPVLFAALFIVLSSPQGQAQMSWTVVDSMGNAFSMLTNQVKPLAHEPLTGQLAIVYRGHPAYSASGSVWWSRSTNGGATWVRVSELIAGGGARYPTAAYSLRGGVALPESVWLCYAAPGVGPWGSWGVYYGCTAPGLFSTPQHDPDGGWSTASLWADEEWIMWAVRRLTPYTDFKGWRTQNFTTVFTWDWPNPEFQFPGLAIGGAARNSNHYFSTWAVWPGDLEDDWNVGYSRSSNGGATWSDWIRPQPDWRIATGLPTSYFWWDFGGGGVYSFDMLTDALGRVHFFGVVEDTVTAQRSIVEIYETATGWGHKIITDDLKESTSLAYGSVNGMGNHLNAAISPDGTVMVLLWLDAAVEGEMLPDIWVSHRSIYAQQWSSPINLTQTPGLAELLLNVAPVLRDNGGGSYTVFMTRAYQSGTTSYPPDDFAPTTIYFAQHTIAITDAGSAEEMPEQFILHQNYPNPFNPSTRITYELPHRIYVRLSVTNVLGQTVKILVDEERPSGRHHAWFDATGLASGVYFYWLEGEGVRMVRKMLLVR